ncbi:MAG: hypothetical protein IJR46_02510, partial [Neisseriaceae bacterium]|nr:hypothetical protein [Neisseriaceae bacterium]
MSIELNITYKRGQYRILKNGKTLQYASDYGYILHTKGRDNEPINCYCGLFTGEKTAYIINQYINGVFNEHKIMLYFHDIEQAKRAYKLTTKKEPESIYTVTKQQLEHWLKYGNKRKPVTEQSFIFDIDNQTTQTAFDGVDWTNENQTAAQIIYGWRKEDTNGELTEPCTLDAIIHDELEDGAEIDETAIFDALAVENKRLERTAILLGKSLNRTSSALKVVENGIHVSKPMRKNGVTNIAIIYELTDGQTVSVLFHNPDTTPNKLKPDDMMIAWRWLLNRKDITIVVAKEKGQDLPIQTIARRVMALVDKNTARFAKANAKKAEETNLIKQLEEENAKLEKRLEYLNKLAEERENS